MQQSEDYRELSIIIPFLDEVDNLESLYLKLRDALISFNKKYEIIFVDDGSEDGSFDVVKKYTTKNKSVKVLQLSRNYGQTAALQAGIDKSSGDIIIPMDGDLQNDPKDIPKLVNKMNEGYDVVSGWRRDRKDGLVRGLLSKTANWIISKCFGLMLHDYGCSLKAYRRECFENLKLYGEIHRFIPLFMYMNGASVAEIPVTHRPRHSGKSKYNLLRTFKVILDLVTQSFMFNYYTKPNYIFGSFGLLFGLLGLIAFCIVIYRVFILGRVEATPMIFTWILCSISSLLFFFIGLLAEMVSRLYFDTDERKPYHIKKTLNF